MNSLAIQDILEHSELFRGCAVETSDFIVHTYRKGQLVTDHICGQPSVGLLIQGIVDVYSVAMDGSEIKLSELKDGDSFGICNLFVPAELQTVLKCQSSATILFVAKETLVQLMQKQPELILRYATICNQKIQFLIQRIELLTMQTCRGKLMEYLLTNTDSFHQVTIPGSKEQMAKILGVSRAALFRELSQLQKEKLIDINNPVITVLNRDALQQILYTQC